MKKFIPFAVAAAFTLGACASGPSVSAQDSAAAIAAAKQEFERADATGYAWRDTEKMIKEAEKLAKEGKHDEAVKLANKAKAQGSNALAQAESQKNVDLQK